MSEVLLYASAVAPVAHGPASGREVMVKGFFKGR